MWPAAGDGAQAWRDHAKKNQLNISSAQPKLVTARLQIGNAAAFQGKERLRN